MKTSIKLFASFLLFGFFIFLGFGSDEEEGIQNANSYEEATKEIDNIISNYQEEYKELCEGPRNPQTETKFLNLAKRLLSLSECGNKCEKLDRDVQIKVSEYSRKKIESDQDLKSVLFGTGAHPKCW